MDTTGLQQELFRVIRARIPEHLSPAEEIARMLAISTDSAYRRMRAEKKLTLDELSKLCLHYQVSLDQLMNIKTGAFLFQGRNVADASFRFDEYLQNMKQNVAYMNTFSQKDFYYLCKDIPVFYHFVFREIAAFKYYFWMKTMLHMPEFKRRKFSFDAYPDAFYKMGCETLDLYNQLNVVEIWNIESFNSTIRQIEFYHDGQMFESDEDIWKIYIALEKMIDHLEDQADEGYMYRYGDAAKKPMGGYQFYINEVILGDNSILVELDGTRIVYLIHSGINFMITRDNAFCNYTYNNIHNLMQKSSLISAVSEKERSRFFKILRERIRHRKESLSV